MGKNSVDVELPSNLDTEEFRAAWADWVEYRREIRRKLTPTAIRLQLRRLSAWGEQKAIAAIQRSIEHGWIGLFEPPEAPPRHPASNPVAAPPPAEEFTLEQRRANIARLRELIARVGVK